MLQEDDEKTLFEQRLAAIQAMPEGDAKTRAIADLSRDYKGREAILGEEYSQAVSDLDAAFDMPQSRTAGPSSNPFAVEIAPSALQYAAQGLRGYNAMQDRDTARQGLETLSEGREAGLGAVMGAGASPQQAMAQQLRGGDAMKTAGFGTLGMSPEEEERIRRMRLGIG